jgi:hypothetical protein
MPEWFTKIWNDPVWSKVIATAIWALLVLSGTYIISKYKKRTLKASFISFISQKLSIWVVLSCLALLFILNYFLLPKFGLGNYTIVISILFFIQIFSNNSKNENNVQIEENETSSNLNNNNRVIFRTQDAMHYHFSGGGEKSWVDNKAVGEPGEGSHKFENKILEIKRTNTEGKYLIKLLRYLDKNENYNKLYVEKELKHSGHRTINIKFEGYITNGANLIWFVTKKVNDTAWIHQANKKFHITAKIWTKYEDYFIIPVDQDFQIFIDDREVLKSPSSVFIKDLIIEDVT